MKSLCALTLVLLVLQGYPPPFPRQGVTQILENDYVRVWDAQFPQNVGHGDARACQGYGRILHHPGPG